MRYVVFDRAWIGFLEITGMRINHGNSNKVFGRMEFGDASEVRTLAIGDIHGCLDSLLALVDAVQLGQTDRLILLGDYIDRGPESGGVINWVLKMKESMEVMTLRGNHEEMMLASRSDLTKAHLWSSYGGLETLASYNADFSDEWQGVVPESHWRFLEQTQLYLETENHIFVHGMINAERNMADQDPYLMVWTKCFGMKAHQSGKPVICGHTAHKDGNIGIYDFGCCIDTAACKGGWLTCLNPDTGEFWQANEDRQTRSGKIADVLL